MLRSNISHQSGVQGTFKAGGLCVPRVAASVVRRSPRQQSTYPGQRTGVVTKFKEDDRPTQTSFLDEMRTMARSLRTTATGKPVLFQINCHLPFGEVVGVCGSSPELGSWEPKKALPLKWSPNDNWFAMAFLPDGEDVEFKFVRLDGKTGHFKAWANDLTKDNIKFAVKQGAVVSTPPSITRVMDDETATPAKGATARGTMSTTTTKTTTTYPTGSSSVGTSTTSAPTSSSSYVASPTPMTTPTGTPAMGAAVAAASYPSTSTAYNPTDLSSATGYPEYQSQGNIPEETGYYTGTPGYAPGAADRSGKSVLGSIVSGVSGALGSVGSSLGFGHAADTATVASPATGVPAGEGHVSDTTATTATTTSSSYGAVGPGNTQVDMDYADPANQMVMTPEQLQSPTVTRHVVSDTLTTDNLLLSQQQQGNVTQQGQQGQGQEGTTTYSGSPSSLDPRTLPYIDQSSLQYRPGHTGAGQDVGAYGTPTSGYAGNVGGYGGQNVDYTSYPNPAYSAGQGEASGYSPSATEMGRQDAYATQMGTDLSGAGPARHALPASGAVMTQDAGLDMPMSDAQETGASILGNIFADEELPEAPLQTGVTPITGASAAAGSNPLHTRSNPLVMAMRFFTQGGTRAEAMYGGQEGDRTSGPADYGSAPESGTERGTEQSYGPATSSTPPENPNLTNIADRDPALVADLENEMPGPIIMGDQQGTTGGGYDQERHMPQGRGDEGSAPESGTR